MDVKEAVSIAKNWIVDVLGDEGISNLGLEEVDFDESKGEWHITLGFSRPWNSSRDALSVIGGGPAVKRAYRVVVVTEPNGVVISMKRRDVGD